MLRRVTGLQMFERKPSPRATDLADFRTGAEEARQRPAARASPTTPSMRFALAACRSRLRPVLPATRGSCPPATKTSSSATWSRSWCGWGGRRSSRKAERLDPEPFVLAARDADNPLEHVLDLLSDLPAGKLAIADVGDITTEQLAELERAGVDAVLVRELPR